jgi:hypothetical protein
MATLPDDRPDSNYLRIEYAPLDDKQKTRTLQHLIASTLEHKDRATAAAVFVVATEHRMPKCKRDVLIPLMREHTCQWNCLVRAADAAAAGEIEYSLQQQEQFGRAPVARPVPPVNQQRRARASDRARRRADNSEFLVKKDEADVEWWCANWPQEESNDALKEASPRALSCAFYLTDVCA